MYNRITKLTLATYRRWDLNYSFDLKLVPLGIELRRNQLPQCKPFGLSGSQINTYTVLSNKVIHWELPVLAPRRDNEISILLEYKIKKPYLWYWCILNWWTECHMINHWKVKENPFSYFAKQIPIRDVFWIKGFCLLRLCGWMNGDGFFCQPKLNAVSTRGLFVSIDIIPTRSGQSTATSV